MEELRTVRRAARPASPCWVTRKREGGREWGTAGAATMNLKRSQSRPLDFPSSWGPLHLWPHINPTCPQRLPPPRPTCRIPSGEGFAGGVKSPRGQIVRVVAAAETPSPGVRLLRHRAARRGLRPARGGRHATHPQIPTCT